MINDLYNTIEKESKGYFKDKGSKFYSYAFPLQNENEVKEIIARLKKEHHSARHHCYAWRLGTEDIRSRANDDGEPSSTAGKPILGQLQSFEVTNALIVVVRYFGGTLLGVSGLINAYRNAATDALNNAEILEKLIEKKYNISFSYIELNEVMHIIKRENYNIQNTDFQESCSLIFSVRKSEANKAEKIFNDLYKVQLKEILE
ncbi:MAG: YigZ family protein [Bacteroidetes bacterium]|nr:YigZ family protein [Bacteroidota bacterium]